jgi:hypothetical protein
MLSMPKATKIEKSTRCVIGADASTGTRSIQRAASFVLAPAVCRIVDDEEPLRLVYSGPPLPFLSEYSVPLALVHVAAKNDGRFCALAAEGQSYHAIDRGRVPRRERVAR